MYAWEMDILSLPAPDPDHRIHYRPDASQIGDLWRPQAAGNAPVPLVVFFHGGWWKSGYDLGYAGHLCKALRGEGIATWSLEYRRVGATGGGWPATFQDAAAGFDFVSTIAEAHRLDLSRVITMGHSAGGHLAFWVAGRRHIAAGAEVFVPLTGPSLRGAISLAGAVDLRLTIELSGESIFAHDRDEVHRLMGGTPHDLPERYRAGNPGDLMPLECPQVLIQGTDDDQIPAELPLRWVERSRQMGSQAELKMIPGADHLDVANPGSSAWPTVLQEVKRLLGVS